METKYFTIGNNTVQAELILEKTEDKKTTKVYRFPVIEDYDILFEGNSINDIKEKFPHHKFTVGDIMNYVYILETL